MRKFFALGRLLAFRNDLVTLWRAFRDPWTPLYLKAAMLGVVLYLISPIDLIPDMLPFLGIVDDVLLVGLAMRWILARLPQRVEAKAPRRGSDQNGPVIDGEYRRR